MGEKSGSAKDGARSVDARATGTRVRRAWFDARFAIGVGLVVASMLAVYAIVSTADRTVQVFAAAAALSPGDRITTDDLVSQNVRLGGAESGYLTPGLLPGEGLIVTRAVSAGELVPVSALGNVAGLRVASVVVTVRGELPFAVAAGTLVDVWSASEVEHGRYGPPAVLVGSATVVRVVEASGIIAGGGANAVELLVPRERVARVLEALMNGDALSLVPVSLPVVRP